MDVQTSISKVSVSLSFMWLSAMFLALSGFTETQGASVAFIFKGIALTCATLSLINNIALLISLIKHRKEKRSIELYTNTSEDNSTLSSRSAKQDAHYTLEDIHNSVVYKMVLASFPKEFFDKKRLSRSDMDVFWATMAVHLYEMRQRVSETDEPIFVEGFVKFVSDVIGECFPSIDLCIREENNKK